MARGAALVVLAVAAAGCGGTSARLSAGDRAACAHATPVTHGIAHLAHFDVAAATIDERVATDPLYPRYPSALLPSKVAIAPRGPFGRPVTVTAFNCADGSPVRLFEPAPGRENLSIHRPSSAKVVRSAGDAAVALRWPPPIQSLGDPDRWLVTPLDYKPGNVVWRFVRGGRVLDRLTFRVCVGDRFGKCRAN